MDASSPPKMERTTTARLGSAHVRLARFLVPRRRPSVLSSAPVPAASTIKNTPVPAPSTIKNTPVRKAAISAPQALLSSTNAVTQHGGTPRAAPRVQDGRYSAHILIQGNENKVAADENSSSAATTPGEAAAAPGRLEESMPHSILLAGASPPPRPVGRGRDLSQG